MNRKNRPNNYTNVDTKVQREKWYCRSLVAQGNDPLFVALSNTHTHTVNEHDDSTPKHTTECLPNQQVGEYDIPIKVNLICFIHFNLIY